MKGYGSLVNFCCEKWLKWLTCLLNMVLGRMIMLIVVVWMAVGRERHLELELGLNSALLITVLYFYFCCCCLSWLYRLAESPVSFICFVFFLLYFFLFYDSTVLLLTYKLCCKRPWVALLYSYFIIVYGNITLSCTYVSSNGWCERVSLFWIYLFVTEGGKKTALVCKCFPKLFWLVEDFRALEEVTVRSPHLSIMHVAIILHRSGSCAE